MDLMVQDLEKNYPDFNARLSFGVKEGELLCLLGPSGCGKTTVLRLIAGFTEPDGGAILLGGKRIDGLPAHRRRIGVVFQDYALFPHMNVSQNIGFGLRIQGKRRRDCEERVRELLELVHLVGFAKRKVSSLSGGEQQRVALARALAPRPRLLLLDEPLSALDAKLRKGLRVEIRRIQKDLGITTVYVTHDQEEALVMADLIAVLNEGRIEQEGIPRAIYERPESRFVASFVGESNLLPARIAGRNSGRVETSLGEFKVLTQQSPVKARFSKGDECVLFFRPEACRIDEHRVEHIDEQGLKSGGPKNRVLQNPEQDRQSGVWGGNSRRRESNRFTATVGGIEYLGDNVALTLQAEGGLIVKARLKDTASYRSGARLTVTVDPKDCLLLP